MTMSHTFRTMCGVCQGGVLSPVLFAICVNDYISSVTDSWIGLLHWRSVPRVFMYADNLVLLSSSSTVLQNMIDVCVHEASIKLDLTFNAKKSSIVRIGKKYKNECAADKLCDADLPFEASVRYVGVFMCSVITFKLSVTQPPACFYKSLNLLLSRSKRRYDDMVLLSLIKTFCLPVLLYGS